ncbi:MAG: SpoIID/LytB domain-containing protein [Bradymonadaceae bacterium]
MIETSMGWLSRLVVGLAAVMLVGGCGFEPIEEENRQPNGVEEYRQIQLPLEAPCTVNVEGFGHVDIEEDYIPNVVACENGNAPMEALKAQAVQARGFLYFKLFVEGKTVIRNSQADQVYKCTYTTAGDRHLEAARATRAQYLSWDNKIIAPFYVAGARPSSPDGGDPAAACRGTGGTDSTNTERYVTYNQGLTGCNIKMTPLGWVPDDCTRNPYNRGCASQNGQACLANRGWGFEDMMSFYYGADVELKRSTGACGGPFHEPTVHDTFCGGQGSDGGHCFDARTRVVCQGDEASDVEGCAHGCSAGVCEAAPVEEDETWFCGQHEGADGWLCFDADQRVECVDGQPQSTETCTAGCEDGQCRAPSNNNDVEEPQDPDDPDPGVPGDDENPPGGEPGPNPIDERAGSGLGPMLSTSTGVEGGCSVSHGSPGRPLGTITFMGLIWGGLLVRRSAITVGKSRASC